MIEDRNTKEGPNRVAVDLTEDRDLEVSSTEGTAPENLRMTAPAPRSEQVEVGLNVPSPPPNAQIAIPMKSETVATLFSPAEAGSLRSRWENIQIEFVDAPRDSVGHADQLVVEAIQSLATRFAAERQRLEQQWNRRESISTEDLRQSLRRYRSFCERILSV
jgi:hypothetical protein